MIFRSETFTALELENTLATSGSRITTFVPCAERRAYFPRSPCEKSYSFRIGFRADLFEVFFIMLAFPPAAPSGERSIRLNQRLDCFPPEFCRVR